MAEEHKHSFDNPIYPIKIFLILFVVLYFIWYFGGGPERWENNFKQINEDSKNNILETRTFKIQ